MACLSDLIGIRGCPPLDTPKGGLFLNDLEGITVDFANATADEEQSGIKVIEQKIALAEALIKSEVSRFFADKVLSDSLVDYDTVGLIKNNLPLEVAQPTYFKGITIEIDNASYRKLQIHRIGFHSGETGTATLKIFDLLQNKELFSGTLAVVQNQVTYLQVDQLIQTEKQKVKLFIAVDATLSNIQTTLNSSGCANCRHTDRGGNSHMLIQSGKILQASQKISENIETLNGTGGVIFDYSLGCSLDNFVCQNSLNLSVPMLYKVAQLMMSEAVFSANLNSFILIDHDLNKELSEMFKDQYISHMEDLLKRMRVPQNDTCFKCFPAYRREIQIP